MALEAQHSSTHNDSDKSRLCIINFRVRARPTVVAKFEPDELKAEEYDEYFDERDNDDYCPELEPQVDIFEEEDYEKNDNAEIEIVEDKQEETENGSEDDLLKSRKRRRISYKVPTEFADDKEEETDDGSDDDLFKSIKRRRNSHKVPTECTICKKTYSSKSSQKEHMQVGKQTNFEMSI